MLNPYVFGSAVYPLDVIGGVAPIAAYSTRKLSSSYAGPCVRVRRSSDNAEQDIGFSGADLNKAAADAFAAGSFLYLKTVYDQSGNGNHATQATSADQPALDTFLMYGSRVIRFDGGTNSMVLPFTVERSSLSMLAVASPQRSGTNDAICQLGADQYFYWQEFLRTPGYNGNRRTPSSLSVTAFTASLGAVDIRINDIVSATVGGLSAASKVGGTWGALPSAAYVSQSTFAALIFYGRKLTAGELSDGKAALHAAFSVPETTTHTIAVFGDSIAAGTGQNRNRTAIHYASEQMPEGVRVYNEAVGGSLLAGQAIQYANFVTYESVAGTVVALQGGTNDIGATVDSAATIHTRISNFCTAAQAAGAVVIVSTILPVAFYDAAQQTRLNDLNTLIRANWATYADVLNDLAADPDMGSSAADATKYPDGLHPSTLGQQLLTNNWVAAFNAALALL